MISHVCLGSTDLPRSHRFFTALLTPLGLTEVIMGTNGEPPVLCWHQPGTTAPRLYVAIPFDDRPATAGNGSMLALSAPSQAAVDAAHAAGLAAGGTDEGAPGPRPHYGPDYYGAYLRDPDGNKLHLVHATGTA
ncbi:lactoylglutathione lyase [Jannaschia pagri]|uniref:Lactoylglutathione lyase n=1 Tax=Jannaschia pagri TaxID=2829797 RepID=A0ABQ4NPS6_9RHOB|nr:MULTISPECIES: VOC family protein [unclassified Jannaschia]GIT92511.1 lactoylglutathione lyase [Jannaschia sp. AI_61]GIT96346.1 lactoylglutathione lyase [Jannaschia sp. AI_62]